MSGILAIDTSGACCSVALLVGGELCEEREYTPRDHTRLVLPMVARLLAGAGLSLGQLDALAFGRGPGSFTGLRISAGIVQGLALGAELPVVGVSSLMAVALPALHREPDGLALVCQDARMEEVYFGAYQRAAEGLQALGEECLTTPSALLLPRAPGRRVLALGSGWALCAATGADPLPADALLEPSALPAAAAVAELGLLDWQRGHGVAAHQVEPVYLRERVAWRQTTPVASG